VTVASTPDSDTAHADAANADIAGLSFEAARDELVRVVAELEQGSSTLEQSLALWERGEALARRCEEWLVGARARLDAARSVAGGAGQASAGLPD
jgi:exodeoxyribonuclease VII small subunit